MNSEDNIVNVSAVPQCLDHHKIASGWSNLLMILFILPSARTPSSPIRTRPSLGSAKNNVFMKLLTLPNGRKVKCQVVSEPADLAKGLMGKKHLPWDEGMLFIFPQSGKHTVWMLDMPIPLDILWLDQGGTIVETACGQPYSLRRLGGNKISCFALELRAGSILQNGLAPGQKLTLV